MSVTMDNPKNLKFVGGVLCLDFVNTVGGRASLVSAKRGRDYADAIITEKLDAYDDLLLWSELGGMISRREGKALAERAVAHPREAAAVLARARALRESLYRIFRCSVEKWRPEEADLDVLGKELAIARDHERLRLADAGFTWAWDADAEALDRMLWPVARSAAELLTSGDLPRVRQCGSDRCRWMFLDTSRNRSRQWCDMKDCGNLAKVRRFRERAKASSD